MTERAVMRGTPVPLAPPTLRVPGVDIFYHGNAIHGRHNLSVFKYARIDKFTYFNINS